MSRYTCLAVKGERSENQGIRSSYLPRSRQRGARVLEVNNRSALVYSRNPIQDHQHVDTRLVMIVRLLPSRNNEPELYK